jgi:hypothetical protein
LVPFTRLILALRSFVHIKSPFAVKTTTYCHVLYASKLKQFQQLERMEDEVHKNLHEIVDNSAHLIRAGGDAGAGDKSHSKLAPERPRQRANIQGGSGFAQH